MPLADYQNWDHIDKQETEKSHISLEVIPRVAFSCW
jgi:hypothetical protein